MFGKLLITVLMKRLAGYCDEINVIIEEDNSITVKDNGRGIPVGIHEKMGSQLLKLL